MANINNKDGNKEIKCEQRWGAASALFTFIKLLPVI